MHSARYFPHNISAVLGFNAGTPREPVLDIIEPAPKEESLLGVIEERINTDKWYRLLIAYGPLLPIVTIGCRSPAEVRIRLATPIANARGSSLGDVLRWLCRDTFTIQFAPKPPHLDIEIYKEWLEALADGDSLHVYFNEQAYPGAPAKRFAYLIVDDPLKVSRQLELIDCALHLKRGILISCVPAGTV